MTICRHFEHIIHIRRCRAYVIFLHIKITTTVETISFYDLNSFSYLFSYMRLKRLIFVPNSRIFLYNFSQSIVWFKALLLIPIQLFVSLEQVELLLI